jgi:hypothetical protein
MTSITVLAAAFTLTSLSPAMAQETIPAECAACQVDYEKYYRGTFSGGGRIIRFLASHYDNLADTCKTVVDANKA